VRGAALAMLRELFAARGPVKDTPKGFLACCPAHPDASPSLNVDQGEKGAVLQCRSGGCSTESIAEALGITRAQLFDEPQGERRREPRSKPKAREEKKLEGWATLDAARAWWASKRTAHNVSAFHYADAKGEPVFVVLRADPFSSEDKKSFAQLVLEGGRWKMGAPEGERPLYLLREMLAADPVEPVLLVEGEKKADLLVSLGFVATTSAQGSKSPGATDWSSLRGRRVVAFADNDEAGRSYVEAARKLALAAGAAGFAVANLDGLAESEDVVDWAERIDGDTARAQLAALVEAAVGTMEQREEEDAHGPEWRSLSFDELLAQPPVEWLVEGLLPRVGVALLASEPRAGKSFLALDVALHLACNGSTFFGKSLRGHGAVAYVALEGLGGMAARARAWRSCYSEEQLAHPLHLIRWNGAAPLTEGQDAFADELRRCKRKSSSLALVIVDTLTLGLAADENDSAEVGVALRFLAALADELRCCVLLLHHVRKDGKLGKPSRMTLADVRGSSALVGNVDCVLGLEHREGREERALLSLKMKDGEQGAPLWFRLVPQLTGLMREDGTPETSCVVESAEPPVEVEVDREEEKAKRESARLDKRRQEVVESILGLVEKRPGLNRTALKQAAGVAAKLAHQVISELLAEGRLEERTAKGKGKGIHLPELPEELASVLERSGTFQNATQDRRNGLVPFRSGLGVLGGERDANGENAAAGGGA
jgi:predicted transcriptional regulator